VQNGFRNPHHDEARGFWQVLQWQLGMGREEPALTEASGAFSQPEYTQSALIPLAEAEAGAKRMHVTWIGHATFLIQIDTLNILTDPIFSERCSPLSFIGPQRMSRPGIAFADLPDIHAVLISHNHYDHLDQATVARLGDRPRYFLPLRLARWFADRKLNNTRELDWWQKIEFAGVTIHCVPAQHFSGRSPWDRDQTLWCGWVIETGFGNIYFAGDTGYSPDFREIGRKLGPMRLSMIPIGAYMPRWFMGPVHVSPPEAVQIHQDVRSLKSIAMHWGTFKLADEPLSEPPRYLQKTLQELGGKNNEFVTLRFGETVIIQREEVMAIGGR
jgi:L-ascorbate metabolism protein UlaG (beta-lactamase superfamily)